MRVLIVFILMVSAISANDCVPLTFSTLTDYTGKSKSYASWSMDFRKSGHKMPVQLDVAVKVWNEKMSRNQLICVYSTDKSREKDPDWQLEENVPLLWFGKASVFLTDGQVSAEAHCAIVVFAEGAFHIVHTLKDNRIYVESIEVEKFFAQTVEVYRVTHAKRLKVSTDFLLPTTVRVAQ